MADTDGTRGRRLDAVAVDAVARRLAGRPEAPWLHTEIARRLDERLAPMRSVPERILDWWAGAGAGERLLRGRYPKARWVAIERDASWLERRAQGAARPRWRLGGPRAAVVHGAGEADAIIGRAQLVWANMVLHAVMDPPALFARWHALLEVEGVVAFSCLGPGTLRELRELYGVRHWPAPTPGFIDMHDLGDMLVAAGFADPVLDQETLSLTWASAQSALDDLRQLGGNAAPDRFAGLRTPAWRRRLLAALGERAGPDGRITLSFEVAYGHGFKASPRLRAGEPVAVPLDDMRAMVRRAPGKR